MLYINKGQENTLVLNINNNSTQTFTGYTLTFTHIMSMEVKSYLINKSNPLEYTQNIRYCSIVLDLGADDLNYEGEYQLNIFGDGTNLVFTGIAILEGYVEQPSFTTYVSPNEENRNYIYIEENQVVVTNYAVAGCERMEYHVISYSGNSILTEGTIVSNDTPECWYVISGTTDAADVGFVNTVWNDTGNCQPCIDAHYISVYSQVIDFGLNPYNSIHYKCDGATVHSCYSPDNQTNITDLVALFNSNYPDPPNPSCVDPTYCYCWTDYGTYYDNGDGRVRCDMLVSVYNTLCQGGTLTLDVIYD